MTAATDLHLHPANVARHDEADFGSRLADRVTGYLGSWRFVIVQTFIVACWISVNLFAIAYRWDPYPFILLNLAFSTQAAYAAPLILLAQNQQSEHDRLKAEHDYQVNEEALELLKRLIEKLVDQAVTDAEEERNQPQPQEQGQVAVTAGGSQGQTYSGLSAPSGQELIGSENPAAG